MMRKEIYVCSYCGEEFNDEDICKNHEKRCKLFISTYKGKVNINYEGYRGNYIGDISIHDLWDRLEGRRIRIEIID